MSRVPLLLGTGGFSTPGSELGVGDVTDPNEAQKFVDCMLQHGHIGIDTARIYGKGTSEKLISQLKLGPARVDTKIHPLVPGGLAPEKLTDGLKQSLAALGPNIKIRVLYLHAPDRGTPFADSLKVINEFYKQGHFEEFGLSNFMSFEVAEVVGICERLGYVKPTVYQGVYNLVERSVEAELFPALRKYGLKFCAYSSLAGGLLTGKHLPGADPSALKGSHFDPNWSFSSYYTARYNHSIPAVVELKVITDKHGLKLSEVAQRWLLHHSKITPEDHGVIIGASRVEQLEKSLVDCEKGPLPQEVVDACEETWTKVKGHSKGYWLN
ncbi:aflatoxin B1-aldehyde reductase [Abortiporus biennis]|nr:aflatoxin B1-aldehyde reductase [Abortiporus biennis]